jgi:hypothetical protein
MNRFLSISVFNRKIDGIIINKCYIHNPAKAARTLLADENFRTIDEENTLPVYLLVMLFE